MEYFQKFRNLLQLRIVRFLEISSAQNCGKKDDYFLKIVDKKKHADWFLSATETKKHGMANHLRVPKISIKVTVDIDFE